jgi:hypothetical protein
VFRFDFGDKEQELDCFGNSHNAAASFNEIGLVKHVLGRRGAVL